MPAIQEAAKTAAFEPLQWSKLSEATSGVPKEIHDHLHALANSTDTAELQNAGRALAQKLPGHYDAQLRAGIEAGADKADAPAAASGEKKSVWPWAVASGTIGAATTALIVWAIMHSHDKKLMAKIASANSQSNY